MASIKAGVLRSGLPNPDDHFDEREKQLDRLEPAWAKAALALRTDMRFGHPEHSIRATSLLAVHASIAVYRRRYEAGDTLAVLDAVNVCATENVPLPGWLAAAFSESFHRFLRVGGPSSLDEVFCSSRLPTDTPKKAANARQDWQLGVEIMVAMWERAHQDETLSSLDQTIELVLKDKHLGVGKTKARELFLMVEKNQIEHLRAAGSSRQPLSRVFAKRRKDAEK